jgi:hypothetical protein
MMLTTRDQYSLECFDRKGVRSVAFDKALAIYRETTGGRVKTDASQIVYWAERTSTDFSSKGDYVEVFGLLRDRQVIGFALAFYIPEQAIYVVDHVAITPAARSMTAFDRFCDLIEGHVKRAGIYVEYGVAEVSTDMNDVDPLLNADTITRLLQIKGFRIVDCRYQTPSADKRPPYRPVAAKLLLRSIASSKISSSTLIGIIQAMHTGLYKNWYKPFAEDFEEYCKHLRQIDDFVKSQIGNREYIDLHGHPPLNDRTKIEDSASKSIVLFFFIVLAISLTIAAATAISWLAIGFYSAVAGAVAVAICIISIAALRYESAARLVRYGIDAIVKIFGRQK